MSSQNARLRDGGRINRRAPLQFQFNGKTLTGYEGDTLASALLANEITTLARSFRYHRPRGILSAGPEEPNALVAVGTRECHEPNVRATTQELYDGLVARSQNCWPSATFDLGSVPGWLSRFLPVGFYYKTFLWPRWSWYAGLVRHMAGLGTAPTNKDPARYEKQFAQCDVLVVGGGASGVAAALDAAETGDRVILADANTEYGGSLLWGKTGIDFERDIKSLATSLAKLKTTDNVVLMLRTTVSAAYDHNAYTAIEIVDGFVRQRLWSIRAKRMILASGAIERPLVFPNNDRPGIMLAGAVRQYVNRYAVVPGKLAIVFTNNDDAYRTAIDLHNAGVKVAAVVDVRSSVAGALSQTVRDIGIRILHGHAVSNTRGYKRLRSVAVEAIDETGILTGKALTIDCDLLCVSGGWSPTLHLLSQAGGKLAYDPDRLCFIPETIPDGIDIAGDAKCIGEQTPLAYWQTRRSNDEHRLRRQWVDLLHDVTAADVAQAAREGFTSVEHLKRYTTIGMAADQGKTSNVNALAILGEVTNRRISDVGTTTFRPPYQPVTLGVLAGRNIGALATPKRRLPLHDWHVAAGGMMEDHSGWQRAACYLTDGEQEHAAIHREVFAARNGVALFDSSSLGKIEVRGPDAAKFLNRIYINNVETLTVGRVRYGMMLDDNGVIIDDGVFARLRQDHFQLCTSSAGTAAAVIALEEWLQIEWPDLDVLINNVTTQWATLTVLGPASRKVVAELIGDVDLSIESFPHMSVMDGEIEAMSYRLMRVSFTGESSFELNVPASYADAVWRSLLDAGRAYDIVALGMEALDVLRIEKGYLEVGVDTDGSTSPLDVGWATAIKKKAPDFIGKRSLSLSDYQRSDRLQLVGLKLHDDKEIVPVGSHLIERHSDTPEGHVTSSCVSPTLGRSIAMAMLKSGLTRQGETVLIDVNSRMLQADVVPLTFFDPKGNRLNENISY